MNLRFSKYRSEILGGASLILIAFAFIQSATSISRNRLESRVALFETLLRRNDNLLNANEKFSQSLKAQPKLDQAIVWQIEAPEVELQRRLLAVIEANGGKISSFGPAIAPIEDISGSFAGQFEFQISSLGLLGFLSEVENISPPVSVGNLWVRAGSVLDADAAEGQINVRALIWGFRSRENTNEVP
jgi:hypothetical protein